VLQQSALSVNDSTCEPAKQAALLELVLAVYERALALVERGVPAEALEQLDFSGVTRIRDEVGPADAKGVERRRDEVLASMDALDRTAAGGAS
jgi:V/A-type H+/Na+-transporting ATPase subunit A